MESSDRDRIFERAGEVGRLISQTPEYAYLKTAHREIEEDEEARTKLGRIDELRGQLAGYLERDEEAPQELLDDLTKLSEEVQTSVKFQSLIAAESNFNKLMDRVHGAIGSGIKAGEQSKIIIPS
jgi:cell fate (sporulation/competence/biofilm development) regulator YlbF (YheA/YmcA/DUF963 family)